MASEKAVNKKISQLLSFKAMVVFLESYQKEKKLDRIKGLLSELLLFPDGGTFDPATWDVWTQTMNMITLKKEQELMILQGFYAMRIFLSTYYEL